MKENLKSEAETFWGAAALLRQGGLPTIGAYTITYTILGGRFLIIFLFFGGVLIILIVSGAPKPCSNY